MIGLKDQCFGVEVEMTGITREQAATALAAYFATDARYVGGAYDKWCVTDRDGKEWTVMSDSSIHGEQKIGSGYRATGDYRYRVEMVTPKLTYAELPKLQECVRQVRHAGAKANSSCGIHVHVDAANHIRDLGKQLLPVGMLVVLDSIFNRIIRNRGLKRNTWIYIDEIYLLFQHEYSANFLFTLWKRMRKYQACGTGISQNIEDLLQSHTARTMLANSEFLIMLNQAATDREELAHLLKISDNQLSYITNVDSGRGLIKCGSAIVPFVDHFPKNKLYQMMTTKPSDLAS